MKKAFFLLALVAACASPAAEKKAGEVVEVGKVTWSGEAKSGGEVKATIKFTVGAGHHVNSSQPTRDYLVPTKLTIASTNGVKAGAVQYGATKSLPVPGEKPEPGYEEEVTITVPLTIAADAKLPVTLPAVLGYQACEGKVCYPPRKLKFDLVVGAGK